MRKLKIMLRVVCVLLIVCLIATWIAADYFYRLAISPQSNKDIVDSGNVEKEVGVSEKDTFNYKDWLLQESGAIGFYLTSYDGLKLHNYEVPTKKKSDCFAIIVHGFTCSGSDMGNLTKYFNDRGYHVVLPDLRGHGESEGDYIGMGWHDRIDLLNLIEFIIHQDKDAEIVLVGVSMGAAAVLMASGEELPQNVKAVIADSAYTSVWDEFSYELKELFHLPQFPIMQVTSMLTKRRAGYGFKEASVIEQVKKSKTPTLFIQGSDDTFVPPYMVEQLYDACQAEKEKLIIQGAGHAQGIELAPDVYKESITTFLNKHKM